MLAHGGGGELTARLIREHLLPQLDNEMLRRLDDSAVLPFGGDELVFTTDSYVVTPLEFPGGDIGRLAVAGTINDLAVMGAEPLALSLALVLEEGLSFATLDRIIASIARTAREAGVPIVTGDTKVIERRRGPQAPALSAGGAVGAGATEAREAPADAADALEVAADGMFINTAGIGRRRRDVKLDLARVAPGDVILINGTLADHGLAIMSLRHGIEFETVLRTDAAPLHRLIARVCDAAADGVKFLRDATRGGLAGVLADVSEACGLSVEVEEGRIPILPAARHAAEMLGLDPLAVANEGKVVLIAAPNVADAVLAAMRADPLGARAARIGGLTATKPPLVELLTRAGGRRIIQRPYGEDLPRIC